MTLIARLLQTVCPFCGRNTCICYHPRVAGDSPRVAGDDPRGH